jgi:hypothetical protein
MDWLTVVGMGLIVLGGMGLLFRSATRWLLEHTGGADWRFRIGADSEDRVQRDYKRTLDVLSIAMPAALLVMGVLAVLS